jgi:mannosyltransferase OCH1-like enzyme
MIPRKIHQIWTKPVLDTQRQNTVNSMRNINKGWRYKLWTLADMSDYVDRNFAHSIVTQWRRINHKYGAVQADLFRYLVMYREGGVYLDVKSLCTLPLETLLLPSDRAVIAGDPYTGWLQWFLISEPEHPFMRETIKRVIDNMLAYDPTTQGVGRNAVLNLSGPTPYTQAVNDVMRIRPDTRFRKLDNVPYYLVYDMIGMRVRESDPTHYSNQSEPLLWL